MKKMRGEVEKEPLKEIDNDVTRLIFLDTLSSYYDLYWNKPVTFPRPNKSYILKENIYIGLAVSDILRYRHTDQQTSFFFYF